jgi:transglycosylase-like protein
VSAPIQSAKRNSPPVAPISLVVVKLALDWVWGSEGLAGERLGNMSQTDRTRVQLAALFIAVLVGVIPAIASAYADTHPKASTSSGAMGAGSVSGVPATYSSKTFWDGGEAAHQAYLASLAKKAMAGPSVRPVRHSLQPKAQPKAAPVPVARGGFSGSPDWNAIAACESGGRWDINTGNGYWGGLQFAPSTWFAYGGGPFDGTGPFPYSSGEQIAVGERVFAAQGASAWPNCFQWA